MEKTFKIEYWIKTDAGRKIPDQFQEQIEEACLERICELLKDGTKMGELCEMYTTAKGKDVECRGWAYITYE